MSITNVIPDAYMQPFCKNATCLVGAASQPRPCGGVSTTDRGGRGESYASAPCSRTIS
jgi:hypothetical protein